MKEELAVIEQDLRSAMIALEVAHSRIRQLEAVIEHFANVRWPDDVPDNYGITIAQRTGKKKTALKVVDFRRAAAALRKDAQR